MRKEKGAARWWGSGGKEREGAIFAYRTQLKRDF
jgi:hypothetical protein